MIRKPHLTHHSLMCDQPDKETENVNVQNTKKYKFGFLCGHKVVMTFPAMRNGSSQTPLTVAAYSPPVQVGKLLASPLHPPQALQYSQLDAHVG